MISQTYTLARKQPLSSHGTDAMDVTINDRHTIEFRIGGEWFQTSLGEFRDVLRDMIAIQLEKELDERADVQPDAG